MTNTYVILSKNNVFAYSLNDKEYELVISKFNMHSKVVEKKNNVFVLKSICFNSTYLKSYIQRIVDGENI